MRWLVVDLSPGAYRADFYLYRAVSVVLGGALLSGPLGVRMLGWVLAGALGWTLLEYLVHRFVLHGLPPFKHWHAEHHRRPTALIAAPTLLTVGLFTALLLPIAWCWGAWPATALSFGLLNGYLAYGLTHHAIHRPMNGDATRAGWRWLMRRCLWHGLHHRRLPMELGSPVPSARVGYYGVSSTFWDRVFGTDRRVITPGARSSSRRSQP